MIACLRGWILYALNTSPLFGPLTQSVISSSKYAMTTPGKEEQAQQVLPGYTSDAPHVTNPSYQQYAYSQDAYAPANVAQQRNQTLLATLTEDDDQQDAASDDGYNAPGIPKEYLNVSFASLANLHAKLTLMYISFQLDFEKCFQEHKSTETIKPIKKVIGIVFKYTKLVVYNILVIVFGFLFAFLWAITYGIVVFILTWIWSPVQRLTLITIHFLLPLTTETLRALLYPLADAVGRIFRQIRVKASFDGGLNLQGLAGRTQNV